MMTVMPVSRLVPATPLPALIGATDEMCCRAPGVMRQRLENSHGVDARYRVAGGQCSVCHRAECLAAVGAAELAQRLGAVLEPAQGLLGRRRRHAGAGVGRR